MTLYKSLVIDRSESTRVRFLKAIPEFQEFCLSSNYDFIVPIETEGLSLLMPAIKPTTEKPQIIPSSSLSNIPMSDFKGRRILIEDATTYTGKTMERLKRWFEVNHPDAEIEFASLVVFDGFKQKIRFPYKKQLFLSQNEYDWAREGLIEYLNDNVFTYFADPPLWSFTFPKEKRSELYESLAEVGQISKLPSFDETSQWIRLNIENINIVDRSWLPEFIGVEEIMKIRIFIHKKRPEIRILPLFFPIIPQSLPNVSLVEVMEFASHKFPADFDKVLEYANESENSPEFFFRWISTVGSLLLLKDFMRRLGQIGPAISPNKTFLLGPKPNLRNYSCRTEILESIESLVISSINHLYEGKQRKIEDNFSFKIAQFADEWYTEPAAGDLVHLNPEDFLAIMLGSKLNLSGASNHEANSVRVDILERPNISLVDLGRMADRLNPIGLSRGSDILVDEGYLNPCIVTDKAGNTRRGYYVGGESKRSLLQFLGYTADAIVLQ